MLALLISRHSRTWGWVAAKRTPKGDLAPMGLPSGLQGCLSSRSPRSGPLIDSFALHVRDLSYDGQDQLPDALSYHTQATNFHADPALHQRTDGRLDIQRIPT